jgi:hypothetical protein
VPKQQEAIQKTKEERASWRERVRGGKNIAQRQEVLKIKVEGAPASVEAEKKTGESQKADKEQGKVESQLPAMLQGSNESILEEQW